MYNKSQQWYDDRLESQQLSSKFRNTKVVRIQKEIQNVYQETRFEKAESRESKKVM